MGIPSDKVSVTLNKCIHPPMTKSVGTADRSRSSKRKVSGTHYSGLIRSYDVSGAARGDRLSMRLTKSIDSDEEEDGGGCFTLDAVVCLSPYGSFQRGSTRLSPRVVVKEGTPALSSESEVTGSSCSSGENISSDS